MTALPAGEFKKNQAMQCAQYLVATHGFRHLGGGDLFVRDVDDQHALRVNVGSKDFMTRGDFAVHVGLGLTFSVVRCDITEFLVEHEPGHASLRGIDWQVGSTLHGSVTDLVSEKLYWYSEVPFSDYVDDVDAAVAEAAPWASLSNIEAVLYAERPKLIYTWAAMANSALRGDSRADRIWDLFLEHTVGNKVQLKQRADEFYGNVQAFRTRHPNGIDD